MELEITIRAELEGNNADKVSEWDRIKKSIDYLAGENEALDIDAESDGDLHDQDLSEDEQAVLQAIRNKPGYALRTVHEQVAEQEDSQFDEYSGEWDDDRKRIQELIYGLESKGLVSNRKRSWYPAEHPKVN